MNAVSAAGDLIGIFLLVVAAGVAVAGGGPRGRPAASPPRAQAQARVPGPRLGTAAAVSVEDRIPGPAALQLEEAVGARDEQDAVPELASSVAARDGRYHRPEE